MQVQEKLNATSNPIIRPNYNTIEAHGVWDRSSYDKDPSLTNLRKEPFLKGLRISPRWATLEPERGNYKWEFIDEAAKKAAQEGKYFYFQLLVGPDSPHWIYGAGGAGVPLVEIEAKKEAKKHKEELKWPYYPDKEGKYVEYLTTTIAAIADHMFGKKWAEWLDRLLFIQVATGSTGDEAPYKGQAKRDEYKLDDKDEKWHKYRMTIFNAYAEEFQKPKRKKSIPLLFNKIDTENVEIEDDQNVEDYIKYYREAGDWAKKNVDYLGLKGSVLPRGYHLTEMGDFIDKFRPYPLDPKKPFILTRAEMDQTWKRPYFQLNLPMNMYWAMLNALHGGLCVWDVSKDILDPQENKHLDEIIPTFEFFNKYAGDLFPESAKGAFIAFHKGLDSSDTDAYPEDKFGGANDDLNKKNKKRYRKICKEYERFGAQMDHPNGATLGQVQQRKEKDGLKGFNDCGWKIPRGNYERFITQIEPDVTDVPLWRIDGPLKSKSPIYSRFARGFCAKEGKNRIYLRVNEKFYSVKEGEEPTKIKIKLMYFDKGRGSFSIKYDSIDNPEKTAYTVKKGNTGKWLPLKDEKGKDILLKDAAFKKRGEKSSDISLVSIDGEDSIFHMLEIEKMN
ncbi:MAG: hypothetical protein AB4372_36675 [Xenococcus sp. (in: cyanobacteria)]